MSLESIYDGVLDKRLSKQVLVEIVLEQREIITQVGLRTALIQATFDILEYVEALKEGQN